MTTPAAFMKAHLSGALAEHGFTGRGLVRERRHCAVLQAIEVQSSRGRFYLNALAYAPELDAAFGNAPREDLDSPHASIRPNEVSEHAPQWYDPDEPAEQAVADLRVLIALLDGWDNTVALVAALRGRKLAQYERVIAWDLSHGNEDAARAFITSLQVDFGEQPRWTIFAEHIDAVVARVRPDFVWRS